MTFVIDYFLTGFAAGLETGFATGFATGFEVAMINASYQPHLYPYFSVLLR